MAPTQQYNWNVVWDALPPDVTREIAKRKLSMVAEQEAAQNAEARNDFEKVVPEARTAALDILNPVTGQLFTPFAFEGIDIKLFMTRKYICVIADEFQTPDTTWIEFDLKMKSNSGEVFCNRKDPNKFHVATAVMAKMLTRFFPSIPFDSISWVSDRGPDATRQGTFLDIMSDEFPTFYDAHNADEDNDGNAFFDAQTGGKRESHIMHKKRRYKVAVVKGIKGIRKARIFIALSSIKGQYRYCS